MKHLDWNKISDMVNARSGRERLIVVLALLGILHTAIYYGFQPILKQQQYAAAKNISTFTAQINKRSHDIYKITHDYKQDTDSAIQRKIDRLNRQIAQFSSNLSDISDSFVNPNEMITLIKMLLNENDLNIYKLENIPPEKITDSNNNNLIDIYKHGLYLETSGSYHNHIRFLDKIENLPWNIFWNEFQLRVDEAGKSVVGLSIYTLTYNPTWLEI